MFLNLCVLCTFSPFCQAGPDESEHATREGEATATATAKVILSCYEQVCCNALRASHAGQEAPRHAALGSGFPEPKLGNGCRGGESNSCYEIYAHICCCSICKVWSYVSSQTHLRICMQIGAEARAEKKHFQLAQIYDEMCRRKWAERAFRGMLFPTPFMACASVLS